MKPGFVIQTLLLGAGGCASIAMAQSAGTFTAANDMTTARAEHTATLLANGKVLIAGGYDAAYNAPLASAELYDPSTGTFAATGSMTTARTQHTATFLGDGRVLIAGGRSGTGDLSSAELYDPSTGAFTATGAMTALRGLHAATLLADGSVLMTGCAIPCNSAIAELYDPAAGEFATTGPPGAGGGPAAPLADGGVLITGGCPADFIGTKAQLFDPGTSAFSFTGLMPNGCANINTATLLMNGKVLVAGSDEYSDPADASLYDPAAETFTSLGHTIESHEYSTATLLPDGTVLIAGGQLPGGNGEAGVELYAPATGTFVLTGSMSAGRHYHTATLLPDGRVLISGGFSIWPNAAASAEIYKPPVLQATPILLALSGDGIGQGAILHAGTPQVASAANPAVASEALEIYCSGLADGSVIPPQIAVGGRLAEVLFFGKAPGYAGLNQVNIRVPAGVAPGPAVSVRLLYFDRPSNAVTIGVR